MWKLQFGVKLARKSRKHINRACVFSLSTFDYQSAAMWKHSVCNNGSSHWCKSSLICNCIPIIIFPRNSLFSPRWCSRNTHHVEAYLVCIQVMLASCSIVYSRRGSAEGPLPSRGWVWRYTLPLRPGCLCILNIAGVFHSRPVRLNHSHVQD